ncbi:FMN-binding protein [Austwickia chelonae]|uniref:FMN-binding protein n=1 Tax=Austwickia chelonae TaxID=100225 RepID=UPI000E2211F3|nr:FMN-binding protein [Austwickia chelonae]
MNRWDPNLRNPAAVAEPGRLRRNLFVGVSTLSAVALAFGYHTSLEARSAGAAGSGGGPTGPRLPGSGASATAPPVTLKDGTYTGGANRTRYGDVQVQIVVSGGKITSSKTLAHPNSSAKDQRINSRAVPQYDAAVVRAQSAEIDAVSGATVTWDGYRGSLQSAIDQARA